MTRLKLAELTSGIGALVPGVRLGAIAHAFGMWDRHRLEAQPHAESGPCVVALYWVCWLLLAGVVMFVFVGR